MKSSFSTIEAKTKVNSEIILFLVVTILVQGYPHAAISYSLNDDFPEIDRKGTPDIA